MSCAKSYQAGLVRGVRHTIEEVRELFPDRTRIQSMKLEELYRGVLEMNATEVTNDEVVEALRKVLSWEDRLLNAESQGRWEKVNKEVQAERREVEDLYDRARGL